MELLEKISSSDLNKIKQQMGYIIKDYAGGTLSIAQHKLSSRIKKTVSGRDSVDLYAKAGIKPDKFVPVEDRLNYCRGLLIDQVMFRCTSYENIAIANRLLDEMEPSDFIRKVGGGVKKIFDHKIKW